MGWLTFDRAFRLAVGLAVSVYLARYLGPEDFGTLNFALAIIAMSAPLVSLGLRQIVVRDLVTAPSDAGTTIGSAFALMLLSSLAVAAVVAYVIGPLLASTEIQYWLVVVLSLTLIPQAFIVIRWWYQFPRRYEGNNLVRERRFHPGLAP